MSIKSKTEKKKIILEIDNGDLEKLTQCMANWKFKDHQSFLRFAMSLLIVTEDKSLWIKSDGKTQQIAPAKEYLVEEMSS